MSSLNWTPPPSSSSLPSVTDLRRTQRSQGSGKTFSMGTAANSNQKKEEFGIIPRVITNIFDTVKVRSTALHCTTPCGLTIWADIRRVGVVWCVVSCDDRNVMQLIGMW